MELTIDAAVIILIVAIMNFAIKKIVKVSDYYPFIVFVLSAVLAITYGLIFAFDDVLRTAFEKALLWGAGSITTYDLVIERLENFTKKLGKKDVKKNNW